MPLISVIVPVYNVEPYLRRCVDSILGQTIGDLELILVDDGSPDNCPQICDEYAEKDARVKVIHQENGGLAVARNAGMKIAKGNYFLFCDSDDYVVSDWCEHLIKCADETQNNFIFGGFTVVNAGKAVQERTCEYHENSIKKYSVSNFISLQTKGKIGFACNVLYYADIIKHNNLRFSKEVIVEDLPFNLEYLRFMSSLTYAGYSDYFYVQYEHTTLSKKYYPNGFKRWQEKYNATLNFIEDCISEEEQKAAFNQVATAYLYYFLQALDNTFDKRNHKNIFAKIRYNNSVVNSKEFQHCIHNADISRENPLYISFLKKKNYFCAYLLQAIAKQKNKIKRRI